MLRIDRLLGEARMLRARRAARAQRGSYGDDVWLEELAAQSRLVGDLSSEPAPMGADTTSPAPSSMVDLGVLAEFVDSCQEAIQERIAKLDPVSLVVADAYPRICSRTSPGSTPILDVEAHRAGLGPDEAAAFKDADRIRRSAALDAAHLVVEMALIASVRRIMHEADLLRKVTAQSDPDGVLVRNGRISRPKKGSGEKARANAFRNFPQVRAKHERDRLEREGLGLSG